MGSNHVPLDVAQLQTILFDLTDVRSFVLGLSGGLDSSVLLHALVGLRAKMPEVQLRVLHINHHLSAHADDWEKHCLTACAALAVPCQIHHAHLKDTKRQGLEACAREARYQIFSAALVEGECLLTAHHQDDQAETLLLQLLRGAGPKGLSAMPGCAPFSKGQLARPLLGFSRAVLQAYAASHQLAWVEDESNHATELNRNFIRHHILPLIGTRWPSAAATLSRSARHCAETSALLDDLAVLDYETVLMDKGETLGISALLKLTPARQRNVLRFWLRRLGLSTPSECKLEKIQSDVLCCAQDAMPLVTWPGVEVRRYRDALYALPPLVAHDPSVVIPWDLSAPLTLPSGLGELSVAALKANDIALEGLSDISIRFRQKALTPSLKKTFQEKGVPPWLRDRVPLLYTKERLVAALF